MMKRTISMVIMLVAVLFVSAQDFSAYRKEYFMGNNGIELPYRLLPPVTADKKYPLVIFLHGAFEKGTDNELQLDIGGRFFMRDSIRNNYPAYVLFPQCPADDSWAYFENKIDLTTGFATDWNFPFRKEPQKITAVLKQLIDTLLASGRIDPARVYIAGLSQGGMGVLDMIARYPQTFAAAISMCGAGDPSTGKLFAGKTPLWLFHGDKDEVVPVDFSRQYYKRLKKAGAVVRYNEYPGVGHNSWGKAFLEPDLVSWLFAQVKTS